MNKNGEFSESKINLYLNQNNLKKRTMQIRNKLFDPSEVLEKKEKTSGFQKIQKFVWNLKGKLQFKQCSIK